MFQSALSRKISIAVPTVFIFSEMHRLLEQGQPIDLITLSESLELRGELELSGGFAYLAELAKKYS